MAVLDRFTEHPASVGETYLQHQRVAFRFAVRLVAAGAAAAIHAVAPWCHQRTASGAIDAMWAELHEGARGERSAGSGPEEGQVESAL